MALFFWVRAISFSMSAIFSRMVDMAATSEKWGAIIVDHHRVWMDMVTLFGSFFVTDGILGNKRSWFGRLVSLKLDGYF